MNPNPPRMNDAATWPLAIVLPLVRRQEDDWPEEGFLVVGQGPRVYRGNVGDLDASPILPQLNSLVCLHYLSFEALAAAGWEVD